MNLVDTLTTPLGPMVAVLNGAGALLALEFGDIASRRARVDSLGEFELSPKRCRHVAAQLDAYFAGELRVFELDTAPAGTPFQQRVWSELRKIPWGRTISYAELATRVGNPGAFRAVGRANATNPIAVVVPCHRVIAADGSLSGYAGGVEVKRALLDLEGVGSAATSLFD